MTSVSDEQPEPERRLRGALARLLDPGPSRGWGVNPIALGAAVVGFGLVVAAEYLPWLSFGAQTGTNTDATVPPPALRLSVANIQSVDSVAYHPLWAVVFALLALALVSQDLLRRVAIAGGIGLLAGQVLSLIGLVHSGALYGSDRSGISVTSLSHHLDVGVYCAALAVVVLAVALVLAGRPTWHGRRTHARAEQRGRSQFERFEEQERAESALEITVTPG